MSAGQGCLGTGTAALAATDLRALGAARFERVRGAVAAFFAAHAALVPEACRAMARRFRAGGRLLSWGEGAAASDAWHAAVEFVHPVIVGKRALPALALGDDPLARLALLGRAGDIALAIEGAAPGAGAAGRLVALARQRGLLTLHLTAAGGERSPAEFHFAVADDDPTVVQEVHETLYHVLWELVHVFLEQGEGDARAVSGEGASFLYPFLGGAPADPGAVLAEEPASPPCRSAEDVLGAAAPAPGGR